MFPLQNKAEMVTNLKLSPSLGTDSAESSQAGDSTYLGYLLFQYLGQYSRIFTLDQSLDRFDTPTINNLGTIAPALGIFYVLFTNFGADE